MLRSMLTATTAALMVLLLDAPHTDAATPEAMAKAHDFAEGKIKAAQVEDLFEVIDYKGIPTARHLKSGMRCHFLGDADRLEVFSTDVPRGDDVGCSMHVDGFTLSFYATRFPRPKTLDDAMAKYVGDVFKVHPDTKVISTPDLATQIPQDPARPQFPEIRTQRFEVNFNGAPTYSRLSVAVINDWVLEERLSGPLEKAADGDKLGSLEMARNVNWMHGGDLLPQ